MRGLGWSQSKNLRTNIVISRDDTVGWENRETQTGVCAREGEHFQT